MAGRSAVGRAGRGGLGEGSEDGGKPRADGDKTDEPCVEKGSSEKVVGAGSKEESSRARKDRTERGKRKVLVRPDGTRSPPGARPCENDARFRRQRSRVARAKGIMSGSGEGNVDTSGAAKPNGGGVSGRKLRTYGPRDRNALRTLRRRARRIEKEAINQNVNARCAESNT